MADETYGLLAFFSKDRTSIIHVRTALGPTVARMMAMFEADTQKISTWYVSNVEGSKEKKDYYFRVSLRKVPDDVSIEV